VTDIAIDFNNIDELTFGEVEILEDRTGLPMSKWKGDALQSMKFIRAMVFIMMSREDSDLTWEDTADIKLSSLAEMAAKADDVDPFDGNSSDTSS
jgi:hypothetical protein